MLALGVDTSNYATSLAVVDTTKREVVCSLKEFLPVKEGELGLRQNDAIFHHTIAIPALFKEVESNLPLHGVNCVAASNRPRPVEGSYMPCFLAGVSAAAAFAAGRGLTLHTTSHQQGHLAAALFGAGLPNTETFLFFHVSGGTTELLLVKGYEIVGKLGGSTDLHAGQAVDRLGVRLGLPFPAGEALSLLAASCTEEVAPKISVKGIDCSFSGLENKCEQLLQQGHSAAYVAKYCLVAVADTVAAMALEARRQHPGVPVLLAGGVMASDVVRPRLAARLGKVHFAPPQLSADNAVGVALVGAKEESHG
ncbi:glycoprotease [Ruminococcaceae bacterium OttesenSCG-928-O06]|nr:glycoprotease [Ruminococcaceae bacterium OttesenSCG-928-O06]